MFHFAFCPFDPHPYFFLSRMATQAEKLAPVDGLFDSHKYSRDASSSVLNFKKGIIYGTELGIATSLGPSTSQYPLSPTWFCLYCSGVLSFLFAFDCAVPPDVFLTPLGFVCLVCAGFLSAVCWCVWPVGFLLGFPLQPVLLSSSALPFPARFTSARRRSGPASWATPAPVFRLLLGKPHPAGAS